MKKIMLIIAVAITLSACNPSAYTVSMPVLPEGFQDCKFAYVQNSSTSFYIARCPNSTTSATYKQGKTTKTTITVDGKVYEEKENTNETK